MPKKKRTKQNIRPNIKDNLCQKERNIIAKDRTELVQQFRIVEILCMETACVLNTLVFQSLVLGFFQMFFQYIWQLKNI